MNLNLFQIIIIAYIITSICYAFLNTIKCNDLLRIDYYIKEKRNFGKKVDYDFNNITKKDVKKLIVLLIEFTIYFLPIIIYFIIWALIYYISLLTAILLLIEAIFKKYIK